MPQTQSEMDIETEEKRIRPLYRFKSIVRLALFNKFWLTAVEKDENAVTDDPNKNIMRIVRSKKDTLLTLRDREVMRMPAELRSEEDNEVLFHIIDRLQFFRKYPLEVQKKLSAVAQHAYFPPGRTLMRQGHEATRAYFIIRGVVQISQSRWHKALQEEIDADLGTMGAGAMFGEVAMLCNTQRQATVVTIEHCELLEIFKEDFNAVLKSTVKEMWDEILNNLNRFKYFDTWSETLKRECCIYARIRNYTADEVILGDGFGNKQAVYLILHGMCRLIETLFITKDFRLYDPDSDKRRTSSGNIIHNTGDGVLNPPKHAHPHLMDVCTLKEGACFNIGESLVSRRYVSVTEVQCLIIPRLWLWNIDYKVWGQVKHFLDTHIPSTQELFQEMLRERAWEKYKKSLVEMTMRERGSKLPQTNTRLLDVPYSLRSRLEKRPTCKDKFIPVYI